MTVQELATKLIQKHGFKGAYEIALRTLGNSEAGNTGGCPLGDEVEMVEQMVREKDRVVPRITMVVDEPAKMKRQTKTLRFWQNVVNYMKARKPADLTL